MAKIKLELTEDHIRLISNIQHKGNSEFGEWEQFPTYSIDINSLYGGSFLFEDIALIIGKYEERSKDEDDSCMGAKFPEELENYMYALHSYIVENLGNIENLVHYYCNKGGITPGEYVSTDEGTTWERKN